MLMFVSLELTEALTSTSYPIETQSNTWNAPQAETMGRDSFAGDTFDGLAVAVVVLTAVYVGVEDSVCDEVPVTV